MQMITMRTDPPDNSSNNNLNSPLTHGVLQYSSSTPSIQNVLLSFYNAQSYISNVVHNGTHHRGNLNKIASTSSICSTNRFPFF